MKAIWNGETIAESNETIVIEGNHYFPPDSVNKEFLKESSTHTTCHWKGEASYYDIEAAGSLNSDAAWFYPQASEAAKKFENYVAFWRGVDVSE